VLHGSGPPSRRRAHAVVHAAVRAALAHQPDGGRGAAAGRDRLRAVAGDRPLCLQRHADLGRGAGHAAGAVHDLAGGRGRRARRRPHRARVAGRAAARALAAEAGGGDPPAGRPVRRTDGQVGLAVGHRQVERTQAHARHPRRRRLRAVGGRGCADHAVLDRTHHRAGARRRSGAGMEL
ncbi:MAG: TRAP-type transport system, small permease component, predicted N-acetylneuraminate transporter, partial [uncultured Ramlibacter sp.]